MVAEPERRKYRPETAGEKRPLIMVSEPEGPITSGVP